MIVFFVFSRSLSSRASHHDHEDEKTGRNTPYMFGNFTNSSKQDFAKARPIFSRGKKKEVLLDDVGGSLLLRVLSNLGNGLAVDAKGRRSEKEQEKDSSAKKCAAKVSRLSLGNHKGERKTKTKPK